MREKNKSSEKLTKINKKKRNESSEKLTKIKKKKKEENMSWIQWALERVPGYVTGSPSRRKRKIRECIRNGRND